MKRTRDLYPILISDENLTQAILEVNRTHRWRPHHKPNKVVAWIEADIPQRVLELRNIIEAGFEPSPATMKHRWDKSAGKWRDIHEPRLWPDQYIHHALIQALQPTLMRGMDNWCCGSIRGRGIHYGQRAIKRWMENDPKGTKYCAELDIHHIGAYFSQWFANTVLQPLDRLIRQSGCRVSHYLRYMDNFTIFSPNKRSLRKLIGIISDWLANFGLRLKDNWQLFRTSFTAKVEKRHQLLDAKKQHHRKPRIPTALGYRYGHGYTLLRKRNLFRLKRQLASYYRKVKRGINIPATMAQGLLSRLGQLKHCNFRHIFARFVKPKTQRDLKAIVRAYARKERAKWTTSSDLSTATA